MSRVSSLTLALPDISLLQIALVCTMAFFASIIGGVAGYGTGLLLPLALVPTIGAESTVPVMALTAMITNASRLFAMRHSVDWRRTLFCLPLALPMTMFAAWFFVRLDGRGAAILIGLVLIALVPLRRVLAKTGYKLSDTGLVIAGGFYGLITGTSTGAGVILVSMLMASGLTGAAIVATDAAISIVIGLAKTATFGTLGQLPVSLVVFAVLIGTMTVPSAFVARWLLARLSVSIHALILDIVVLIGGSMMVLRALLA